MFVITVQYIKHTLCINSFPYGRIYYTSLRGLHITNVPRAAKSHPQIHNKY